MDGMLTKPFTLEALAETLEATANPRSGPRLGDARSNRRGRNAGSLLDLATIEISSTMQRAERRRSLARLVQLFVGTCPMSSERHRDCGADGPAATEFAAAAHKLKSISLNLGRKRSPPSCRLSKRRRGIRRASLAGSSQRPVATVSAPRSTAIEAEFGLAVEMTPSARSMISRPAFAHVARRSESLGHVGGC